MNTTNSGVQGEYYIKQAYTTNTKTYTSRTDVSLDDFFLRLKVNIAHDFNVVLGDFELVETGQPEGERADAVVYQNDRRTLAERYGNFASFYFRPKNGEVGFNSGPVGLSGAYGSSSSVCPSGTSGTSGPTGASGTSGTSGPSGASGTSGTSGPTGTSGTSGTSGPTGASGTSGPTGTSGTSGPSGRGVGLSGPCGMTSLSCQIL